MTTDRDLDLCTNTQAELAAELDEAELAATEAPLPAGWRRFKTARLDELLAELDDSTFAYEDVAYELAGRAMTDDRVAQATGNARGELPS